jgi:hypothetical protein
LLLVFLSSSSASAQPLSQLLLGLYDSEPCTFQGGTPVEGFLCLESRSQIPGVGDHDPRHFQGSWQNIFSAFNAALASELTALPLPSPASGFTYSFDPVSGAVTRSTQSFGPIFAERAETIGARKFTIGFNYQYFNFDNFHDFDLTDIPSVFEHDGSEQAVGGLVDIVSSVTRIETKVNQLSFFFTYGFSDRFDVAVAVPLLDVSLSGTGAAILHRVGSFPNASVHFFPEEGVPDPSTRTGPGNLSSPFFGDDDSFGPVSGSASGIGDIILRAKGNVLKSGSTGLALGLDLRLPTGDEMELLGSGATGIKPFAALSFSGKVSPHVNVAYQWNGESTLAATREFGPNGALLSETEKGDLPDQLFYAVGLDAGVHPSFTIVFDFLGRTVLDGTQPVPTDFPAVTQNVPASPFVGQTFPDFNIETNSTFSVFSAAAGLKARLGQSLLFTFNVLFKLNDNGLRDKFTPLFGLEVNL